MKIFGLLLAALAVGSAGCTKADSFTCLQSSECMDSGVAGVCEPSGGELGGICSFPNPDCPSGKAFGEFAGEQAGLCVGDASTSSPTSSVSNAGTASATSSETSSDPSNGTTVDVTTMTTQTTMTSEVTVTTETTLTTDSSTTTGPVCAPLGGACTADTPCCGDGCTDCSDGTCTALPAEQGPNVCGSACQMCSAGACAPADTGTKCPADCSDFVLQALPVGDQTVCNGYAPMPLAGSCNDGGVCSVPDPVAAGCTPLPPTQLAVCDTTCVTDAAACTPGVTGFDKADFCALNGPGPGCKTVCLESNSSNMASCDGDGICQQAPKPCGNYLCNVDNGLCRTKCAANSDCAAGHSCKGTKCQ